MSRTIINIRTMYYFGIGLLVLNALPAARKYFEAVFDYQVTPGLTAITIIGVMVAIGAFFAYNRRYI